jgi:hypothetical protein
LDPDRLILPKKELFGKCGTKSLNKLKNASPNKDTKNEETATYMFHDTLF